MIVADFHIGLTTKPCHSIGSILTVRHQLHSIERIMSLSDPATDGLYADAINPDHPYHSNPQTALSLLAAVIDILQSIDPSDTMVLKWVISYIYFESAYNSGISSQKVE